MVICESTLFCDRIVFVRKDLVGGEISSFTGVFYSFQWKNCVGSCLICTRKCRGIRDLVKFSLIVLVSMKGFSSSCQESLKLFYYYSYHYFYHHYYFTTVNMCLEIPDKRGPYQNQRYYPMLCVWEGYILYSAVAILF